MDNRIQRIGARACLVSAVICLIVVLVNGAAAAQATGAAPIGKTTGSLIADYIQQQASASRIPGVAVGIVQGSRPVLVKAFGNVAPDTSFFLASLSKSFTALAIMQLVGQGKVSLTAPVRRYIPWFRAGRGSESNSMTVIDLLDQTSGISNKAGLTELSFSPDTTFQQAIKGFETFPLIARPGTVFQYSDANYTIAGYIVQQASGESYDNYVRQHIFAPLGMTHSYAITGTPHVRSLTRGYANWFGLKIPLSERVAAPEVPAGFIISSATDMTHYLIAQMNGGVYSGTRVASAQAVREMHAALVPLHGQTPVPDAISYGLGWGVGFINGSPVIAHDGQLRDFETVMAILPKQKIAVILLMNEDPQVPPLNDEQIYTGVMQGITTGTFPPVSHTYLIFYIIFDTIALATLLLMVRSFWRTRKWLNKFENRVAGKGFWPAAIRAIGLDLAIAVLIALLVTYGLGSVVGYVPLTPTLLIFAGPDVATWIYAIIVFFVVRAVIRAIVITARRNGLMHKAGSKPSERLAL
jgi:CubicO group peptidase (beta-lactamase class C family)